jgi:hypothetical protein
MSVDEEKEGKLRKFAKTVVHPNCLGRWEL